MKLSPVQIYQNSREEMTPTGRATERLIHHPYETYQKGMNAGHSEIHELYGL